MKLFHCFLLVLVVLYSAACSSKNDDPQPDPTPAISLKRVLRYLAASHPEQVQAYSQRTLHSSASLHRDGKLFIDFLAFEGKDHVDITVPRASLTADLRGTYTLRSQTAPQGPAEATYRYYLSNAPGSLHYRSYPVGFMQGQLTITAYDAQRQLLSGTYSITLPNVADPHDPIVGSNGLRCSFELEGSFDNLKLSKP